MRVLVLDTYYEAFLAEHYRDRPGLEDQPYGDQLESLLERCFGTADGYTRHLRRLGHEAEDVIANCDPLQRRWATEHRLGACRWFGFDPAAPGLRGSLGRRARRGTLLAQVEAFAPDIVYAQAPGALTPDELEQMRSAGASLVAQVGSLPPSEDALGDFDLLVTPVPSWARRFRERGWRTEVLPLAYYEAAGERLRESGVDPGADSEREIDVSFVGGLGTTVHARRRRIIEEASRSLPIEVWGYGDEQLEPGSPIRHRGEVWGLDMYSVLARSKIVVNVHGEVAEGQAANMRMFEATGMGALLLTDGGSNLADLFEPGREVVTFDDAEDLVAKARHYLANEDERRAIAAAGQERTLREHSYERRMGELEGLLRAVSPA
jgi:spore maturation protein CgeB